MALYGNIQLFQLRLSSSKAEKSNTSAELQHELLNTSEFIIMINSRHILNLSIELIIKPQGLDKTSCYKCIMALKGRLIAWGWG
jgi:hypothetical protein